eukprot:403347230
MSVYRVSQQILKEQQEKELRRQQELQLLDAREGTVKVEHSDHIKMETESQQYKYLGQMNEIIELYQIKSEAKQKLQSLNVDRSVHKIDIDHKQKQFKDTLSILDAELADKQLAKNQLTLSQQNSQNSPRKVNPKESGNMLTILSELQTIGRWKPCQSRQQYIADLSQLILKKLVDQHSSDEEHKFMRQCELDADWYCRDLKKRLFPIFDETITNLDKDSQGQSESYYDDEDELDQQLNNENQIIMNQTIEDPEFKIQDQLIEAKDQQLQETSSNNLLAHKKAKNHKANSVRKHKPVRQLSPKSKRSNEKHISTRSRNQLSNNRTLSKSSKRKLELNDIATQMVTLLDQTRNQERSIQVTLNQNSSQKVDRQSQLSKRNLQKDQSIQMTLQSKRSQNSKRSHGSQLSKIDHKKLSQLNIQSQASQMTQIQNNSQQYIKNQPQNKSTNNVVIENVDSSSIGDTQNDKQNKMKQVSLKTIRDSLDIDEIIQEQDFIESSFRQTLQNTQVVDTKSNQLSHYLSNQNFQSFQNDDFAKDGLILIDKMQKEVLSKAKKNPLNQTHSFGNNNKKLDQTFNGEISQITDKHENNRLFNDGQKLRQSLIDLDKTYGLVEEIQERQRRKNQSQLAEIKFNSEPLQDGLQEELKLPIQSQYQSIERQEKWNRVKKFMEKNPKVLLNVLSSPNRQENCTASQNHNEILNLITSNNQNEGYRISPLKMNQQSEEKYQIHPLNATQFVQKIQWFSKGRPKTQLKVRDSALKASQREIYYFHKRIMSQYFKAERNQEEHLASQNGTRFHLRKKSNQSQARSIQGLSDQKLKNSPSKKSNYRTSTAATYETNPTNYNSQAFLYQTQDLQRILPSQMHHKRIRSQLANHAQNLNNFNRQRITQSQIEQTMQNNQDYSYYMSLNNQQEFQNTNGRDQTNLMNINEFGQVNSRPQTSHYKQRRLRKLINATQNHNQIQYQQETNNKDNSQRDRFNKSQSLNQTLIQNYNVEGVMKDLNLTMFGKQPEKQDLTQQLQLQQDNRFKQNKNNNSKQLSGEKQKLNNLKNERNEFTEMKTKLKQMLESSQQTNQSKESSVKDQNSNNLPQSQTQIDQQSKIQQINSREISQNKMPSLKLQSNLQSIEIVKTQNNSQKVQLQNLINRKNSLAQSSDKQDKVQEASSLVIIDDKHQERQISLKLRQSQKTEQKQFQQSIQQADGDILIEDSIDLQNHEIKLAAESSKQEVDIQHKNNSSPSKPKNIFNKKEKIAKQPSLKCLIQTIQSEDLKRMEEENQLIQEQELQYKLQQIQKSTVPLLQNQDQILPQNNSQSQHRLENQTKGIQFSQKVLIMESKPVLEEKPKYPYKDLKYCKQFKEIMKNYNQQKLESSQSLLSRISSDGKLSQGNKSKVKDEDSENKLRYDDLCYTFEQMKKFPKQFAQNIEELKDIAIKTLTLLQQICINIGMKKVYSKIEKQFNSSTNEGNDIDFKITYKLIVRLKMMHQTQEELKFIFQKYVEFQDKEQIIEQLREERVDQELILYQINEIFDVYQIMYPRLLQFIKDNKIYCGVLHLQDSDVERYIKQVIDRYTK